jgi:DNA-directed RNA polymerase alpha subunit
MNSFVRNYRDPRNLSWIIRRLSRSEIDIIIESLQKEAKLRDENTKKELENGKSGITIVDFVNELPLTIRMQNALMSFENHENLKYIDDVTKEELFKYRNFWKKSWEELVDIINNSLQGTRFEEKQAMLKKHFEK